MLLIKLNTGSSLRMWIRRASINRTPSKGRPPTEVAGAQMNRSRGMHVLYSVCSDMTHTFGMSNKGLT